VSWDVAASISEVVGAAAVVISLVYLAIQVRENTTATKAAAFEATIQSEMDLAANFVAKADVWDKVLTGAPLTAGAERRTAIILFNMLMLDTARRYRQFLVGHLDEPAWEARRGTLPDLVSLPIFEFWRPSMGAKGHEAGFLKLLDDYAARQSRCAEDRS
jgi:hypothetical protein